MSSTPPSAYSPSTYIVEDDIILDIADNDISDTDITMPDSIKNVMQQDVDTQLCYIDSCVHVGPFLRSEDAIKMIKANILSKINLQYFSAYCAFGKIFRQVDTLYSSLNMYNSSMGSEYIRILEGFGIRNRNTVKEMQNLRNLFRIFIRDLNPIFFYNDEKLQSLDPSGDEYKFHDSFLQETIGIKEIFKGTCLEQLAENIGFLRTVCDHNSIIESTIVDQTIIIIHKFIYYLIYNIYHALENIEKYNREPQQLKLLM